MSSEFCLWSLLFPMLNTFSNINEEKRNKLDVINLNPQFVLSICANVKLARGVDPYRTHISNTDSNYVPENSLVFLENDIHNIDTSLLRTLH